MYGDYVQARSSKQSVPYQSIIEEDLKRYSYKRKHNIRVRLNDAHLEQKTNKNVLGAPLLQPRLVRKT